MGAAFGARGLCGLSHLEALLPSLRGTPNIARKKPRNIQRLCFERISSSGRSKWCQKATNCLWQARNVCCLPHVRHRPSPNKSVPRTAASSSRPGVRSGCSLWPCGRPTGAAWAWSSSPARRGSSPAFCSRCAGGRHGG